MSTPELKHFPERRRTPGDDVIGVLPHHPRRDDVRAVLVEADVRNAGRAAAGQGLSRVEVLQAAPALCGAGATVIWTRQRRLPDLTPQIRAWFAESGFDEIAFEALETSVGVNRLCDAPGTRCPATGFYLPRCMTEQSGQMSAG